ncbi:MAG: DUF421 domain-containing protein [Clostridia bacterium]|nr:DUF421 domain-containing protein [Clostridia bacterium]
MPYVEVLIQTVLAFGAIMIYTRILGKQQIGQLTFFEYINGITFGSIAAVLATDIDPERTALHFLGLTIFAALTFGMGYLAMVSRPARKLFSGEPTIVVHNGKILEDNMRKMRYNIDELLMQLRDKQIFNLEDIEYAVLEPNGNLSVLPKSQKRPVTPNDLGIPTGYEGIASELVVDGKIIYQNLEQNHLDQNWLLGELQKHGVTDIRQVALATLSTDGTVYVDFKKDNLASPTDISDAPAATKTNPPRPHN